MYKYQRDILRWANSDKKNVVQLPRGFGKKTMIEMWRRISHQLAKVGGGKQ